ncbi:hypothetical protein MTR67_027056 [Solanum verrucosum]|uniref:Protein kinase domain-containing protein n=1 Tax=Solanum verrucosum TaxID=315347 RepID=A0AAF0R8F3_SOLVR|nr:hypothetical protein MTR67_027056 [Solanum verrucosum]
MVKNGNALMQKYELGRLLGQGNFGKVYYGRNLESGQTVAIKVIDKEKVQKAGLTEQTKREISGGELFNTLTKGRLKEDVARKLFQQLINAAYVAPEVISRKGYKGVKADIWSCGVILFVLLAGYLPFYDSNLMNLYRKICRAEYKCPHWFPLEVRKLLSRILDPNPHKRISIAKIKESSWFKKGLGSSHVGTKQVVNQNVIADGDAVSSSNLESSTSSSDTKLELMKPAIFSAFHILCWFNLSGLFINNDQKGELRFTSVKPAPIIISKLVEVGRSLNLEIKKKEGGFLRLEGLNESRYETLCIDVQIFEISESHYYFIELSRSSGDAIDYQNMLTQTIRPAFEEIVLAWQGVQSHQQ